MTVKNKYLKSHTQTHTNAYTQFTFVFGLEFRLTHLLSTNKPTQMIILNIK